jgi:excinuclease ABC subunit C
VYLPDTPDPVAIPRGNDSLYLLQRIRDEAHRFAITYHRTLRGKRMVDSVLDDVPGIGEKRKQQLVRQFGSVKRIREASKAQLAEILPDSVAGSLWESLHG